MYSPTDYLQSALYIHPSVSLQKILVIKSYCYLYILTTKTNKNFHTRHLMLQVIKRAIITARFLLFRLSVFAPDKIVVVFHFLLVFQFFHGFIVTALEINGMEIPSKLMTSNLPVFRCASAKAERSLSSLSCVWMYVDQNLGTPPPGFHGSIPKCYTTFV